MKHKLMAAVLVGTMVMSTVGTTTVLAQENDKIELDMWVFGGLSAEPVVFQEMAENFNNCNCSGVEQQTGKNCNRTSGRCGYSSGYVCIWSLY